MSRPTDEDPGLVSAVVTSAREGLREDWEWRHEVVSNVIVRLADDLAAAKAERDIFALAHGALAVKLEAARGLLYRWRFNAGMTTIEIDTSTFLADASDKGTTDE
jgi:hypothetical protein